MCFNLAMEEIPELEDDIFIPEYEEEKGSAVGLSFLSFLVFALVVGVVIMPWLPMPFFDKPEWWAVNMGEYHPVILHLPIGIMALVLFMEVCGWMSFGRYVPATGVALFLAFITGVLACVTGYFELIAGDYAADKWEHAWYRHMWAGIAFVAVLGLTYIAKLWRVRNRSKGPVYGILLLLTVGVMGYGSHIGGEKVHKTDPFEKTMKGLQGEFDEEDAADDVSSDATDDGEEVHNDTVDDSGASLDVAPLPDVDDNDSTEVVPNPVGERLAFAEVVMPILEEKCWACHSEREDSDKGGLLMDSYANLIKGGDSQFGDEDRTLVPGNAEQSLMVSTVKLPLDDEYHMPPNKKKNKQLEAYEIALLTWWVNSISPSDSFEDKTLTDLGATPAIIEAAELVH